MMMSRFEHDILFTGPMVRALLAGTKTQTRRVLKAPASVTAFRHFEGPRWDRMQGGQRGDTINCRYGVPGDRLRVREAWGYRCSSGTPVDGQFRHTIQYRADDARQTFGPMPMDGVGLPKWRERDQCMSAEAWDARMTAYWRQWRPSIHMPRWASRITLEVTAVRVERLQDISEADALAEGIVEHATLRPGARACNVDGGMMHACGPVPVYRWLWESINGPESWDANPWVWVVAFRRVTS